MLAKRHGGKTYVARQEFSIASTAINADRWDHRAELPAAYILASEWENKAHAWWDIPVGCKMINPFDLISSPAYSLRSISKCFDDVAAQPEMAARQIGGPIRAAISDDMGARWLSD